jgi:rRNA pseudouridine-1189 N-methylase Emg1 (Nep1/Mra1 family)
VRALALPARWDVPVRVMLLCATTAPNAGTSHSGKLVDPFELVAGLPQDRPVVFVFGAMAKGTVKADYVEETYSFSQYPVSGIVWCH